MSRSFLSGLSSSVSQIYLYIVCLLSKMTSGHFYLHSQYVHSWLGNNCCFIYFYFEILYCFVWGGSLSHIDSSFSLFCTLVLLFIWKMELKAPLLQVLLLLLLLLLLLPQLLLLLLQLLLLLLLLRWFNQSLIQISGYWIHMWGIFWSRSVLLHLCEKYNSSSDGRLLILTLMVMMMMMMMMMKVTFRSVLGRLLMQSDQHQNDSIQ